MKFRYAPLALACALMMAGSAHAASVTVNFNDLAHNYSYAPNVASPYVSDGFEFTDTCRAPTACFYVWGRNTLLQADTENAALAVAFQETTTTVKQVNGENFDLHSIDLADAYNDGANTSFVFTFVSSGGSTQETVTLDSFRGLQTVVFNKTQLTEFSFAETTGMIYSAQFDNVVLNAAAVPEPGTYALMLAGLAASGLTAKRRKT